MLAPGPPRALHRDSPLGIPGTARWNPRRGQASSCPRAGFEARSRRLGEPTSPSAPMRRADLHWMDAGSEAFLATLVEGVPTSRILLLTTSRPELRPPWAGAPSVTQLRLVPLGPEATAALLDDLPRSRSVPCRARGTRPRTHCGNPFFVEEVVQALVESGSLGGTKGAYHLTRPVEAISVPATVQAVLAAGSIGSRAEKRCCRPPP